MEMIWNCKNLIALTVLLCFAFGFYALLFRGRYHGKTQEYSDSLAFFSGSLHLQSKVEHHELGCNSSVLPYLVVNTNDLSGLQNALVEKVALLDNSDKTRRDIYFEAPGFGGSFHMLEFIKKNKREIIAALNHAPSTMTSRQTPEKMVDNLMESLAWYVDLSAKYLKLCDSSIEANEGSPDICIWLHIREAVLHQVLFVANQLEGRTCFDSDGEVFRFSSSGLVAEFDRLGRGEDRCIYLKLIAQKSVAVPVLEVYLKPEYYHILKKRGMSSRAVASGTAQVDGKEAGGNREQ